MKYYVQYTQVRNNKVYEILGSDGVFILDGRNNLRTMICDAMIRMNKLRRVMSPDGYKIMKGERFDKSKCVYEWLRSGSINH